MRRAMWIVLFASLTGSDVVLELTVREQLKAIDVQKEELRMVYEQKARLQRALSLYQLGCHTPAAVEERPPLEARHDMVAVITAADLCAIEQPNQSPRHRYPR